MPPYRITLTAVALVSLSLCAGAAPLPARGVGAAAGGSPAATARTPVESARYTDPTYNFSLIVPAFAAAKERTLLATFQGPAEDGFAGNVTLVTDPGATTRDAYLEASMKQMSETNP